MAKKNIFSPPTIKGNIIGITWRRLIYLHVIKSINLSKFVLIDSDQMTFMFFIHWISLTVF